MTPVERSNAMSTKDSGVFLHNGLDSSKSAERAESYLMRRPWRALVEMMHNKGEAQVRLRRAVESPVHENSEIDEVASTWGGVECVLRHGDVSFRAANRRTARALENLKNEPARNSQRNH